MPSPIKTRWLTALLLVTAALGWLWLGPPSKRARDARSEEPAAGAEQTTPSDTRSSAPSMPAQRPPAPHSAPPAGPGARCAPHAGRECHAGDVYWFDACGERQDKAEECGARLCQGDACEPSDPLACAGMPLEGRCEGNVVRGCLGGWPFERDCAALGKRCVMGDEGAVCRKPSEDDCDRFGALPRCEGETLLTCTAGKRVARDCAAMNARCGTLGHTGIAACVLASELDRRPRDHDPCGPCGCPAGAPSFADEQCNGEDDDGDRRIDEDVRCDPLQVMAFVITDGEGSSYTREDIELEIANADALFSGDHGGLRMHVELAGVVELARPQYLMLDDSELGPLIAELSRTAGPELRVPIVFTDELSDEDVPRAGLATLPNGECGGVRRALAPQPLYGLVAVGKRRASTTVAHEIGHFLGLCHTHEADPRAVVRTARWRESDGRGFESTCDATCSLEGDGMCDTPRDPGPETCDYDSRCDVQCASGESPSTHNVMSYYTECRDRLTPQQTIELRRTRALLEGWYRCADPAACPCVPQVATCPEQMSCRPVGSGATACTLDGAFVEGERCRGHAECGKDLLCIDQHCSPWPEQ